MTLACIAIGSNLASPLEQVNAAVKALGEIPQSGLALRPECAFYDAQKRLSPVLEPIKTRTGCRCGDVLRGSIEPCDCPLFGRACVPQHPLGACMVSSEGACAAYYQYEGAGL